MSQKNFLGKFSLVVTLEYQQFTWCQGTSFSDKMSLSNQVEAIHELARFQNSSEKTLWTGKSFSTMFVLGRSRRMKIW